MADEASPSARLTAAASELLEAAGIEVSSGRQQKISTDIVSFKESVDAKLNTVNQTLVTSRTHIDDKLNSINQHVVNLEERMASLEKQVTTQSKMQSLEFAMDHTKLDSFQFYLESKDSYAYVQTQQSCDFVTNILMSFRRNFGYYLPGGTMTQIRRDDQERWEKSNEEFRNKLITQIHTLTGTKPRVVKEADGRHAIYYS